MLFLWALACPASNAGDDPPCGTDSIAQSKKRHLFLGRATAKPDSLHWNGHAVTFREVWLERGLMHDQTTLKPEQVSLYCTLLLDGKPELGKFNDKSSLQLVPEDTRVNEYGARLYSFGTYVKLTPVQRFRYGRGSPNILAKAVPNIHAIFMPSANLPSEIKAHLSSAKPEFEGSNASLGNVEVIFHLPVPR
jgi:hypothetical protein